MNNKAQIFEIYLVVLTAFLCAFVVFMYFLQQSEAESSLVSPKAIFEARDELEIFELKEKELILNSLEKTRQTNSFDEQGFNQKFFKNLIEEILSSQDMQDFLFKDYVYEQSARANPKNFLENLYSVERSSNNELKLIRAKTEKRKYLQAEKRNSINFPTEFSFNIEKQYLISYKDNRFIVEV